MGDERARQRYRNNLFDKEAKAATRLLDQVRQYVGRSGVCQPGDFEDLCTIHHAINTLFERVKRFTSNESIPRVYGHSGVKAYGAKSLLDSSSDLARTSDSQSNLAAAVQDQGQHYQLSLPGSNNLEEQADYPTGDDAGPPAPLFDLVRQVPDVSMQDLCRDVELSHILGGAPAKVSPSRPVSSSTRGQRQKKASPSPRKVAGSTSLVSSRPVSSAKSRGGGASEGGQRPSTALELLVEVSLEWTDGRAPPESHPMQEMRLELQVVELPSRTPMRSLRITNRPGLCGTVMLEVSSLRRAELCMALVKDLPGAAAPWDESGEFAMLSPGGNEDSRPAQDVSSALRVPVSQLLHACASGASLEWEADGARTMVVQGKMHRGGKAVEYFPGNLQAVPESLEPALQTPQPPPTPAAGRGAAAAEALRSPGPRSPTSIVAEDLIRGTAPPPPTATVSCAQGTAPPPPTATVSCAQGMQNLSDLTPSDLQNGVSAKLSAWSKEAENGSADRGAGAANDASAEPTSGFTAAPHPPAAPPPQRKPPRPVPQPRPEDEAAAVSRYVSRLLLRGSNKLRKRADKIKSGSRPTTPPRR